MKKLFAILMAICMMASVLCVPAFAAEPADELPAPAADTVLRATALLKDGKTIEFIGDYDNFEDGWNAAMDIAGDTKKMKNNNYDRVVVDLLADWTATDGEFTDDFWNGPGFDWDTIYIPDDARVTLNLNGHTIDRALTDHEENGEVICVDSDADIIINNGTITGGHSDNGAGGIHIHDNAYVTLNDVHIVGNAANEDDGGGIAVYDGATLVMNGGSFVDNTVDGLWHQTTAIIKYYGGAVYVEDSTAIFNNVDFKNNNTTQWENYGAAIYAADSNITINECTFDGNGIYNETIDARASMSVIQVDDSVLMVKNSTFINNGGEAKDVYDFSSILALDSSELIMEKSEFSNNAAWYIINDLDESLVCVTDTKFLDNKSSVMCGDSETSDNSFFKECAFENNGDYGYPSFFNVTTVMTFYDCSMGDSTFSTQRHIKFVGEVFKADAKIGVSALKNDGTTEFIAYYNILDYGWNAAMALASDHSTMKANGYERIVVDLYVDWNAEDGAFTGDDINGTGFKSDAVCFPENVCVTLNMNGHTINRNLKTWEYGGAVMYVNAKADVIINDGTITGGFNCSGAGGIHIYDANVTLNNVRLVGNTVEDDDGAAIAVHGGGRLTMNGGCMSNNHLTSGYYESWANCWGTLYTDDSTAVLNKVTISGNTSSVADQNGLAVGMNGNSEVTLNDCTVENNGEASTDLRSKSLFYSLDKDSRLCINGGTIKSNCLKGGIFYFDGTVEMNRGIVAENNVGVAVFHIDNTVMTVCNINNVTFTDNAVPINIFTETGNLQSGSELKFTNCTFHNNGSTKNYAFEGHEKVSLQLIDCDLGDSAFSGKEYIKTENADELKYPESNPDNGSQRVGSIFGEGSLAMIVATTALIASAAAIFVSVSSKKKAVSSTANNAQETEDEE